MLVKVDFKKRETNRVIKGLKNSNKLLLKDVKEIRKQLEELQSLRSEKKATEKEIETLSHVNKNLKETLENFGKQVEVLVTELT